MNFSAQKKIASYNRNYLTPSISLDFFCAVFIFFTCVFFTIDVEAADLSASWPDPGIAVTADAAVVIDADTHTLLYDKNRNEQHYPASITKIMTALLTLENCGLDETVTVTEGAVTGLGSGAVIVGLSVGDTLSVRDLLYATLLRSANDAAAALAIHVAGSIDAFAQMMNEKAIELGCTSTNFTNPHGLPDNAHVTSAYDMALIMAECIKNEDFLEIESHDSYTIAGTIRNPGGYTVTMGHRMLRSGTNYSDDRVIAGKTGYTMAAGNTLVTAATDGERTVITVLMSGKNPDNYQNTSSLIDFGLGEFVNVTLEDSLERFDTAKRLATDHIAEGSATNLLLYENPMITVPSAYIESNLSADYEYNLPTDSPELAVAIIKVLYADRTVGTTYVLDDRQSKVGIVEISEIEVEPAQVVRTGLIVIVVGIAAAAGSVFILGKLQLSRARAEQERLRRLRKKRMRRLVTMGIHPADFKNRTKNQTPLNRAIEQALRESTASQELRQRKSSQESRQSAAYQNQIRYLRQDVAASGTRSHTVNDAKRKPYSSRRRIRISASDVDIRGYNWRR